ncbi:MAG: hypothetical protein IKV21_06510 [Clostridia bacterium]|nr:hypothetical protein [Clostridia bacterium]
MSIDNKKLKVCPRITEASVTDKGEIRLEWTEVPMADKYAVQRAEKSDGDYERIAWAKKNTYTDTTAKKDITYWYRIVAQKELENKKKSKKASPVAAQVVSDILAPASLKAVAEGKKIKLSWEKAQTTGSYLIYRRNSYFNQFIPLCKAEGDSYTDKDIVQGQIYYYSIQSLDGDRQGNFSGQVHAVSLDCGEIIYSAARFLKKIDLKARIVAGADGYIFERSEDGEKFEEIGRTDSDISLMCTDTVKKAFSVYYYRVRAYKNVEGNVFYSKPSKVIKVKSK